MEAEKNKAGNMNSVLRQALERRQTEHLSSNFSYRMMERVRLEAERPVSYTHLEQQQKISSLVEYLEKNPAAKICITGRCV